MTDASSREYLLDVSRLLWRVWSGRLPTGIDRVCLEYVRNFGARALALVQFRDRTIVLSARDSDRLFALLEAGGAGFRWKLAALAMVAATRARLAPPRPAMVYLNAGHTGLDNGALAAWIDRHQVKAVYLIHDLIPLTHPEYCRPGEAEKHERRIANALATAAGIIANSKATLDDLETFAAPRGLAMPPATVAWISGPDIPADVAPHRQKRPYFVTLGTIEGRKNHLLLLDVWKSLVANDGNEIPELVIIGQRGWRAERVIDVLDRPERLERHVRELGRCDDAELANWLAGARALLMPSFAEGFGLPVIEAIELGTPVIASDLPVYREIVGEIPTYLDPRDGAAWAAAIRDFEGESQERSRQLTAMRGYRPPDWKTHFGTVEAWLRTI